MTLPKQYAWLAKEGSPRLLVEALRTAGLRAVKIRASACAAARVLPGSPGRLRSSTLIS